MFCGKSKFCSSFSALKLAFSVASVTLLLLVLFMQNETVLDDIEINGYPKFQNVRKQWYANYNPMRAPNFFPIKSIAIACALSSKGMNEFERSDIFKHHLIKDFMPSFCKTATTGYTYSFYLSFDKNDTLWNKIGTKLRQTIKSACKSYNINVSHVKLIKCNHNGKPPWAQNDAMIEAYLDGMDYGYRINDDTLLTSKGWTEIFISVLESFDPPNVGVVGPTHSGGNTNILTYDFTSNKHIDIFGYHYPRLYTDWYGDTWINQVYQPHRVIKLKNVHLKHLLKKRRYDLHWISQSRRDEQVKHDQEILQRYLKVNRTDVYHKLKNLAIGISLWKDDKDFLYGALRQIQLANIFFPRWRLRLFIPINIPNRKNLLVPENLIMKMKSLGAEMSYVDMKDINIPLNLISLLILKDKEIEYFIIREARQRFSECDLEEFNNFVTSNKSAHYIKSSNNKTQLSLSEMWEGNSQKLRTKLNFNQTSGKQFVQNLQGLPDGMTPVEKFTKAWLEALEDEFSFHKEGSSFFTQHAYNKRKCVRSRQLFDYRGKPIVCPSDTNCDKMDGQ